MFLRGNQIAFDESKISIDEILIGINECSIDELKNGYKT